MSEEKMREAFQFRTWWKTSKYRQVVYSPVHHEQISKVDAMLSAASQPDAAIRAKGN